MWLCGRYAVWGGYQWVWVESMSQWWHVCGSSEQVHLSLSTRLLWLPVCFGNQRVSQCTLCQRRHLHWRHQQVSDWPTCVWLLFSGLLRVLESPWKSWNIFFQIFKAWKVLENRHGPWKSLNLCLKVLGSAWIWFRTEGSRTTAYWQAVAAQQLLNRKRTAHVNSVNTDWHWHCAIDVMKSVRSNCIQWQLLMHLVNFSDNSSFWSMLGGVKLSNVNWTCLYMLIKGPVWVNLVLRMTKTATSWL